ncbi:MAG TPA: hypothetical protein VFE56_05355 [Candidatus Binataceae bacterium]|nr:hypothetical protein [Candidatus Binataceae bacterium]
MAYPVCVLIADTRREQFPLVAGQWAMLRGMPCWRLDLADGDFPAQSFGPQTLLALSYPALSKLGATELRALNAIVRQGATLYVRGGFESGAIRSLSPFGSGAFKVSSRKTSLGYQLTDHDLVPDVLRTETAQAETALPGAQLADCAAQGLACAATGGMLPFIFALRCGLGVVIYDLMPDEVALVAETPILQRLSDPAARCSELGALIAVNYAVGRENAPIAAYNILLDDRPRNYDYLNAGRVTRWLGHLDSIAAGTHVDFAWTPIYSHPGRRYIRALKRFNTGFIWHGLLRHIDHRGLKDPAASYAQGLRRVEQISRRYGVRFEPVIVLPYQEADRDILRYLGEAGFRAAVFNSDLRAGLENPLPAFMRHSTALHELYLDYLPVLRRYPAPALGRDLMLANAALGLPIIAAGHPENVGLRRLAPLYAPRQPVSRYFDEVVGFARAKRLRPLSLEEIATEMISRPRPVREAITWRTTVERIDVAV